VVHLEIMKKNQTVKKVLTFFAHPDDETMFLGGTFAYLASRGVEVHFICATRGEGGEMGNPPICSREDLGLIRESELRCAVEKLGGTSLQFAGYKDPVVGPEGELYPFTDDLEPLAEYLKREIQSINPQVIITHGSAGEYGHPGHIQAHQAVMLALKDIPDYSGSVYSPAYLSRATKAYAPEPDIKLDIFSWKEQKTKAALCHRSQNDLFIRNGSARAGRQVTIPEMIRSEEALCQIIPARTGQGQDPFIELLSEISAPDISNPE